MNKAVFFDRDGILNRIVMRGSTVSSPWTLDEFRLFPDARDLISVAHRSGFLAVVVTNQPDVSRRNLDACVLEAMHQTLSAALKPDAIEVCTSSDDKDPRRKPNPGMLRDAARRLDIDLARSLIVGDGIKDIRAGRAAGVTTVLLQTSYNQAAHGEARYEFTSLQDIMELIRSRGQENGSLIANQGD